MTRESGDIHKVAGENKAVDDSLALGAGRGCVQGAG